MACVSSVKGHHARGSRDHGKQQKETHEGHQANSQSARGIGQKSTSRIIKEDSTSYHEGISSQVRQFIAEWEA